jgi:hypothetical protein
MLLLPFPHDAAATLPQTSNAPWLADAAFWVVLASLVALTVVATGVWALVYHVRRLREDAQRLSVLDELDQKLGRLVRERDDLDLRRIEHVLIDVRDGHRRLEDALLRVAQLGQGTGSGAAPTTDLVAGPSNESIGERVGNRFLALGYEQVQIVTRTEKLAELVRKDGEVLIEARKDGVLYKGRAILRGGSLVDVEMNPAYSIFP